MSIEVSWYVHHEIMLVHCAGQITARDVAFLNQQLEMHLSELPAYKKVEALVDCREIEYAIISASELYEGVPCLQRMKAISRAVYVGIRHNHLYQIIRLVCLLLGVQCYRSESFINAYDLLLKKTTR